MALTAPTLPNIVPLFSSAAANPHSYTVINLVAVELSGAPRQRRCFCGQTRPADKSQALTTAPRSVQ